MVGLTVVEPLAAVEVKVPGVMEMLVAPVAAQVSVLLPELMLAGVAVNEVIVSPESCPREVCPEDEPEDPQFTRLNVSERRISAKRTDFEDLRSQKPG